jgi:type I restriction enzyme M protein
MRERLGPSATADQLQALREDSFWGREKADLVYPIALANLVLHGIDHPHIWHGNTLTNQEVYGGLFTGAPSVYDVILMNPPFGGKEGKEAQTQFAYKTSATQLLFLQHVIGALKPGGRCGMVIDEGVLFRTTETAFVQTKRKLLNDCDLWCILSLPPGVFSSAGAGVKTNLLFFTRGGPTERVWYYDLSDIKVGKKTPLTADRFDEFFALLPTRADSDHSWTVTRLEIERRGFDLKAVNPNAKSTEDTRTPEELLDIIESKGREASDAIAALRHLLEDESPLR